MIQKNIFYVSTIILLFSFLFVSIPVSVDASPSNVTDWIADEQSDGQPGDKEQVESVDITTKDTSLVGIIGKLIFYTLLILVMIYGLIKFLALRQQKMQPNQAVKLIGGTPLGNNKSLQLVKVGNTVLLIGVGDQVSLIKEISDADEINSIEKNLEQQPTLLSNSLSTFIKDKIRGRTETKTKASTSGFEHLFSQSLNKQKAKQDQLKFDLTKEDDDKEGSST
ncbi:flagellar biosynthetic protein FliO [Paenisporosarcina indica]|uniref:flagellar biosynthetic protein FliO n=1 Tax=Paenisporosarcina indica TaxID=650093 RepID=UPI00095000EA|nr:flagellar biosynthetic protein FliO [Paenisporosarcina indica]